MASENPDEDLDLAQQKNELAKAERKVTRETNQWVDHRQKLQNWENACKGQEAKIRQEARDAQDKAIGMEVDCRFPCRSTRQCSHAATFYGSVGENFCQEKNLNVNDLFDA